MANYLSTLSTKRNIATIAALIFAIAFIFSIFYLAIHFVSQQDTRSVSQMNSGITITSKYLVDESATLTAMSVKMRWQEFISTNIADIPFDLNRSIYWIQFKLSNNTDKEMPLVLHIDNAMLSIAQVFDVEPSREGKLTDIETATAFPTFNLTLARSSSQSILLKLGTSGPPDVPLIWYHKEQYQTKEDLTRLLFGGVIGVLAIMGLYNLVIFAAVKDIVYLAYLGYLIFSFLVLATINGYGYLLFSADMQQWFNSMSLFFHYYLTICLLCFGILFLKYHEQKGWLYRIGMFGVTALVVLSIVMCFFSHKIQAMVFFSLVPLFYGYSLLILILRFNQQFYWARFYALSWLCLLVGVVVQPLVLFNYLDYSFLFRNAFLIAVVVEVMLMAFALAERVRRHEGDRLHEMSYHSTTGIVRRALMEKTIRVLIKQPVDNFSVLVIRPEHIERIALYVNNTMNTEIFKQMHTKLTPLFADNDAIEPIGPKGEKMVLIAGNSLGLIVHQQKNTQSLANLIKSVHTLIEQAYQIEALNVPLNAAVGIAHYPKHGNEPFLLINKAQLALPQAEMSQSRWAYFTEHTDISGDSLQLASDINQAINDEQFMLYHQPQIDLKTMRVCGSECLIRWQHKEKGFIAPDVFISIAEDMGLINRLTQWVIKKALHQHHEILMKGNKHHMVSINISGKDITAEGFFEFVVNAIEQSEISPNRIIFELTESATITDNNRALNVINKLNELGITISIDDFGTGYSSMVYISQLPFQELKIDRQFVENVCDDNKRKTIVETTVQMAKGLEFEVVAEGINSQLDEDTLRNVGCDIGQGYFYAKPMAFDDYIEWLSEEINGRSPQPLQGDFIPKSAL